jgi:DNA-binding CsgD family transcriptional regulator
VTEPLSRAHRLAIHSELKSIGLSLDETIGRNATNPHTRSALREIREAVDALIKKVDQLSKDNLVLTKRESEILIALKSGATALVIARKFSISQPTVKSHLAAIYRKLGVNNKTNALAEAAKRGLLP